MDTALIEATLDQLSRVFHQEADFQQALASGLHEHFPSLTVRAEYPVRGTTVDLWLVDDEASMAVELRYPKKQFEADTEEERFALGNDPTDMGCYGYLSDLQQLEALVEDGICDYGVAVLLSNDSLLWDNEPTGANYDEFKLYDGRTIGGKLAWAEGASLRSSQDRTLELANEYTISWQDYSYQYPEQASGNTSFKYCITAASASTS